jgi:hypothetical protein
VAQLALDVGVDEVLRLAVERQVLAPDLGHDEFPGGVAGSGRVLREKVGERGVEEAAGVLIQGEVLPQPGGLVRAAGERPQE